MLHQDLNDQCSMKEILLRINLYYFSQHFCLRGCPFNQLSLHLFKQGICPIYGFPFHSYHDGYGISITKITDLVPLINNLNYCKETNVVRFFHHTDIPLFYIDIGSWQNNALKHSFCNILIYLLMFFLTLHKWSSLWFDRCWETALVNHGVVLSTIV